MYLSLSTLGPNLIAVIGTQTLCVRVSSPYICVSLLMPSYCTHTHYCSFHHAPNSSLPMYIILKGTLATHLPRMQPFSTRYQLNLFLSSLCIMIVSYRVLFLEYTAWCSHPHIFYRRTTLNCSNISKVQRSFRSKMVLN